MAIYEVYQESKKLDTAGKIVLRKEQLNAVALAKAVFSKPFTDKKPYHKFLWNAKMRFGKTLCAMQLAKEMGVKRTLIVTHRPVVNKGWAEDFEKIFEKSPNYDYGTRSEKDAYGNFDDLERFVKNDGKHYVFFVSMQYLRLSKLVKDDGDKDPLKQKILETKWDFVVVDEAHEGTQTSLGHRVVEKLCKPQTRVLHLSGTPFNLYDDFGVEEIFTWDYLQEQKAKREWNSLMPNPYAELPCMKIFTYDLGKLVKGNGLVKEGAGFMFSEFFRTWTGNTKLDGAKMPEGAKGRFVHESSVKEFLDLLCKKDETSNYPFSTDEYRTNFKHTLWVVPGVKEAKALEGLLKAHQIFKSFKVVNVAGETDDDVEDDNALDRVLNAIGEAPEKSRTITISCGRLTTGTTVKPWTAVFYMKGSESTNVATYMQTIFRVQTPYHTTDGKMKAEAYVFDFAPDRSLKMLAETARFSAKVSKDKLKSSSVASKMELAAMKELLNFCPVIAYEGGQMKAFNDEHALFAKLAEAKIDRVVQKGFDDNALYNVEELLKMDPNAVNKLWGVLGKTASTKKAEPFDLAKAGLEGKKNKAVGESGAGEDGEEDSETAEKKAAEKAARKERDNRIAILRGVSLRIPLLMFGAEVADEDKDVTVDNFASHIDDASWEEFMPRGFTKKNFDEIKACYDHTVFKDSWRRYRQLAREADGMKIEDRIKAITTIFGYFHNPDKETVLTPWRVVNMHMSDTIGGYAFFNEKFDGPNLKEIKKGDSVDLVETNEPRWVEQKDVTNAIFKQADANGDTAVKVLEINSKTGLYPLYVTYSLYRSILPIWQEVKGENGVLLLAEEQALWDKILQENIFVICNTPMAARITERTLRGFRKVEGLHIKDEKLVEQATKNQSALVKKLNSKKFWYGEGNEEMKFTAVVGNPPYQENQASEKCTVSDSMAGAIYPMFIELARGLKPMCISMITPSRWMTKSGRGVRKEWVDELLKGNRFVVMHDFPDASECFPNVEIKGGVSYFLYKEEYEGKCYFASHIHNDSVSNTNYLDALGAGVVIRDARAMSIIRKVSDVEGDSYYSKNTFASLVGPNTLFCDCAKGVLNSNWDKYSVKKDAEHPIKYYLNKTRVPCGYAWIREKDIIKAHGTVKLHKVFIPEAGGSGDDPMVLGKPFYGAPGSICSQTYICIGYDPSVHHFTKTECENIVSYIKTKFFRYMVSIKKKTQHAFATVYAFVPNQDFSKAWSDIDLYAKYKLTADEIAFIESMIKPME